MMPTEILVHMPYFLNDCFQKLYVLLALISILLYKFVKFSFTERWLKKQNTLYSMKVHGSKLKLPAFKRSLT